MVYPSIPKSNHADLEKRLEEHITSTASGKTMPNGVCDGWSVPSYDSAEMGKFASPFDDIGFLASGPEQPSELPPKGTRKVEKKENRPKPRNKVAEESSASPSPALGKFLETTKPKTLPPGDAQSVLSHRSSKSRRLDKTFSHRDMFKDDEASLALSVALGRREDKKEGTNNRKTTRSPFGVSKPSLGLSILGGSRNKGKVGDDSKDACGTSKSTFFTAMTSSRQLTENIKSMEASKSSLGMFGTSKPCVEGPCKTKPSKFSMKMRKTDSKLSKSEERVSILESQNLELSKENNLLQAKLKEISDLAEKQKMLKDWRSSTELPEMTKEMWQYQSLLILADIHMDRLEAKIAASSRLIQAKERSICNLEGIRNKQEKRIEQLELLCLRNCVKINEEKELETALLKSKPSTKPKKNLSQEDDDFSGASFAEEDITPLNVSCNPVHLESLSRSNRSKGSKNGRSRSSSRDLNESASNSSVGFSDVSSHSSNADIHVEDEGQLPESSWGNMDSPGKEDGNSGARLGEFLDETKGPKIRCVETGTWDPAKELDFDKRSPRGVGAVAAPPPPPDATRSDPMQYRKTVSSQSTIRSKSPGTRRRLKGAGGRPEGQCDPQPTARRSRSPGTRRAFKDELTAEPAPISAKETPAPVPSSSNHALRRRKKSESMHNSNAPPMMDSLDRRSTHSTKSRGRRRQLKQQEFDRQTVNSALNKVLGSSLNALEDMEDDFFVKNQPSIKQIEIKASNPARRPNRSTSLEGKPRRKIEIEQPEEADIDLDAVFRD